MMTHCWYLLEEQTLALWCGATRAFLDSPTWRREKTLIATPRKKVEYRFSKTKICLSLSGGYDSDVERERTIDYVSKTYVNPIRDASLDKPKVPAQPAPSPSKLLRSSATRNTSALAHVVTSDDPVKVEVSCSSLSLSLSPPSLSLTHTHTLFLPPPLSLTHTHTLSLSFSLSLSLTLSFSLNLPCKLLFSSLSISQDLSLNYVFGYRGYDTRQNLFYAPSGELVYHAAGAGILCDPLTNHQSFYLNHNDDIVCMALNPRSTNVIATGQIGKNAPVHIWDLQSRETLSIVQGAHSVGVCSVDFSHNGKLLLCVGLDSKHSITVWRWTESE